MLVSSVAAQTSTESTVSVKPTTPDSPLYSPAGRNVTLSFLASSSQGGVTRTVENATVTIEVFNQKNEAVQTFSENTTGGVFTFNYTSSTAEILTFTPTQLITENNQKWAANSQNNLEAASATVWFDTFQVALAGSDTQSANVAVTVNVTYLLLPQEGLTLPASATYSGQTFLPKAAGDVNVTINGVSARQTATAGVYTATFSTWLPTAYVHVAVSRDGWVTTHKGFSFAEDANSPLWLYAVVFASVALLGAFVAKFLASKRSNNLSHTRHQNFPLYGAALLFATTLISLYWTAVAFEGTVYGFEWLLLIVFGVVSIATGVFGCVLALRRRNQAFATFAVIIPLLMNVVGVKSALDTYQLANPWLILLAAFLLSVLSGYFITNSDALFKRNGPQTAQPNV